MGFAMGDGLQKKGLKLYLWALRWGIDCSGLSVNCEGSSVCETVCNRLTLNVKGEGEKNTRL